MSRSAAHLARVAWLILPVIAAGLTHAVVLKLDLMPRLTKPIDGGRTWRGRPLLGSNKTWRGVLVMTLVTGWLTGLQSMLESRMHMRRGAVSPDYRLTPFLAGSLIGLTYCLSELPNSFFKRRLAIAPGQQSARYRSTQYVIDQIDSAVGCLIALRAVYRTQPGDLALAFVLGSSAHVSVDRLLYVVGVKRSDR